MTPMAGGGGKGGDDGDGAAPSGAAPGEGRPLLVPPSTCRLPAPTGRVGSDRGSSWGFSPPLPSTPPPNSSPNTSPEERRGAVGCPSPPVHPPRRLSLRGDAGAAVPRRRERSRCALWRGAGPFFGGTHTHTSRVGRA